LKEIKSLEGISILVDDEDYDLLTTIYDIHINQHGYPICKSKKEFRINKIQKDKVIRPLEDYIDKLVSQNTMLRLKLNNFNKEEEIKKLNNELTELRSNSIHCLTIKEKNLVEKFRNEHWESCKGNIRYIIEGTGLGNGVSLQCTKCSKSENITDYDKW